MKARRYARRQLEEEGVSPTTHNRHTVLQPAQQETQSPQQSSLDDSLSVFSSDAPMAAPLKQAAVVRLQKTMGNAAIARAVGERRTLQSDAFKGDSKLEAVLNDEDRLKSGDRGDSVVKVQEALIRDGIPLPQFGADGAYGGETATAVKQFKGKHGLGSAQFGDVGPGTMGKLDELNANGKKDTPPEPKKDEKDVFPALEAMLDHVSEDYVNILRNQDKALVDFERDMRTPDTAAPNFLNDILLQGALKVIEQLLPVGSGMLYKAVVAGFRLNTEGQDQSIIDKLILKGIDAVFEEVNKTARDKVTEELNPQKPPDRPSLERFADAQRNALFDATIVAMQALSSAKETFREFQPQDEPLRESIGTFADPRFDRAGKLRLSTLNQISGAHDKQYITTSREWSVMQAQNVLSTKETVGPDFKGHQGTDVSRLADKGSAEVPGVLEIEIPDPASADPNAPVQIVEVRIFGLSQPVREQLVKMGASMTIGELGFPRRIMDHKSLLTDRRDIAVARNEVGFETFTLNLTDKGRAWLEQFGGSEQAGVVKLLDEVDARPVSSISGGIQAP